MKALSIKQPWVWLILHHGKDCENRSWTSAFRGPVLLHASSTDDTDLVRYGLKKDFGIEIPDSLLLGGIVGVATVIDCVSQHESRWFCGPHAFLLKDARPLPFRRFKGSLGFFETGLKLADLEAA